MSIKSEESDNISQTVYCLMRGVYNLEIFKCPYNDKVANELTSESGKAFHTFFEAYEAIDYLSDLLNFLNRTNRDFDILEMLLGDGEDVLRAVTIGSFKLGCGTAVGQAGPGPVPPLYEAYWKKELQRAGGRGSEAYARLLEDISSIKRMLYEFDYDTDHAFLVLDRFFSLFEQRFSVFADTAFSYGRRLASGELPVWINPEFPLAKGAAGNG